MNWCMGESHYCVPKHPLKGQHNLQMGTQFVIWMKPVGVSLWKAQLELHFSRVELVAFLPNSRTRSKPFIFMACNMVFYYFFSMACNTTRVVAWRDHDIQKKMKQAFLDRTHLYLLSELYLSPLAFCAAAGSICKPRKALQSQGKPRRQLIHLETAQPKQSPVTWTVYTESLGSCAANLPSGLSFYELFFLQWAANIVFKYVSEGPIAQLLSAATTSAFVGSAHHPLRPRWLQQRPRGWTRISSHELKGQRKEKKSRGLFVPDDSLNVCNLEVYTTWNEK